MKNKILIFSTLFFMMLVGIDGVEAVKISGSSSTGSYASTVGCPSGNCYKTIMSGVRIAIVDSHGKRCKYSSGSKSICTGNSVEDASTNVYDYWFYVPDIEDAKDKCYAITTNPPGGGTINEGNKMTKQELIDSINSGTVRYNHTVNSCVISNTGYKGSLYNTSGSEVVSFKKLTLQYAIPSWNTNIDLYGSLYLEPKQNPENVGEIISWFTDLPVTEPASSDDRIVALNNIVSWATKGKISNILDVNDGNFDDIYIQFEPITYFYTYNGYGIQREWIGSVSEVAYMLWSLANSNSGAMGDNFDPNNASDTVQGYWDIWLGCYLGIDSSGNPKRAGACFDGTLKGIYGDEFPNTLNIPGFSIADFSDLGSQDFWIWNKLSHTTGNFNDLKTYFVSKNTRNVAWISLSDMIIKDDPCKESEVQTINNAYKNGLYSETKYHDTISDYVSARHIKISEYPYMFKSNYKDAGLATCDKPSTVTENKCPYDANLGNCTNGQTSFKDNGNSNNCWLNEGIAYTVPTGSSVDSVSSKESTLGNDDYCPVYCYETFKTDFPKEITEDIKSGQVFKWGIDNNNKLTNLFGKITVTRTCQTKENQTTDIVSKILTARYRMTKFYADYKAWSTQSCVSGGTCANGGSIEICSYNAGTQYYVDPDGNTVTYSAPSNTSTCSSTSGDLASTIVQNRAMKYKTKYETQKNKYYKYLAIYDQCTAGITNPTSDIVFSGTTDIQKSSTSSAKLTGGTSVAKVVSISSSGTETEISASNNTLTEYGLVPYTMGTKVTIDYEERISKNKLSTNLIKIIDPVEGWHNIISLRNYNVRNDIYLWDCDGTSNSCTQRSTPWKVITFNPGGFINLDWQATYQYIYPDSNTWFANSSTNEVVQSNSGKLNSNNINYTYLAGYGFPTSLQLSAGRYDISASVENIGSMNSGTAHFSKAMRKEMPSGNTNYEYTCKYNTINEIIDKECIYDLSGNLTDDSPEYCDPIYDEKTCEESNSKCKHVDIDVQYRVIDLEKPFPGKNGTGVIERERGSNWKGVSVAPTSNVYNNSHGPMYHITLTPAIINQIRQDNHPTVFSSTVDGNQYTSYYFANNDPKISCKYSNSTTIATSGSIPSYSPGIGVSTSSGGCADTASASSCISDCLDQAVSAMISGSTFDSFSCNSSCYSTYCTSTSSSVSSSSSISSVGASTSLTSNAGDRWCVSKYITDTLIAKYGMTGRCVTSTENGRMSLQESNCN